MKKSTTKSSTSSLRSDIEEVSSAIPQYQPPQMVAQEATRNGFFTAVPQYVLIVLLMLASYFIGNLKTKVDYMQGGVATAPAAGQPSAQKPASKYKNIDDAITTLAKEIKLDDKKLASCISSGEKAKEVAADLAEGQANGVNGTPGFFINGKFLGGAFPFESFKEIIDKELDGTGSEDPKVYSANLQQAATRGQFDPKPKQIELGNAQRKGASNPKVTIIEYSDFQCPFCKQANPTLAQVMKEYDGKVQIVFKDYPLSFHPHAQKTAEAASCAADQGKFWEMHDKLFETQDDWSQV